MRLSMLVFLQYEWPPGYSVALACLNHHRLGADEGDEVAVSEAAKAAVSKFRKVYFVSFLQKMAKLCDCFNEPLEPVIPDIGILAGSDILAVERATYDLIVKREGRDVFKELNKKSFAEQLKAAEEVSISRDSGAKF